MYKGTTLITNICIYSGILKQLSNIIEKYIVLIMTICLKTTIIYGDLEYK